MKKAASEFVVSLKRAVAEIEGQNGIVAILLFFLLSIAISLFFFSLESLYEFISLFITCLVIDQTVASCEASFISVLISVIPSFLLLMGVLWIIHRHYRKERQIEVQTKFESPSENPKKGLIFLLGPYQIWGKLKEEATALRVPVDAEKLNEELDGELTGSELRTKMMTTTWGPLLVAVEAHQSALQHIWFVNTNKSRVECKVAEKMIRKFLIPFNESVSFYYEENDLNVKDGYDINAVIKVVDRIYNLFAPAQNLEMHDIIADFTGGLKSMTAGMILATLDQRRKIQYLRQDKVLIEKKDGAYRAVTNVEIESMKLLTMIETKKKFVPVARRKGK